MTEPSRLFPTAGTFAYACTLHAGMIGTAVVQEWARRRAGAARHLPNLVRAVDAPIASGWRPAAGRTAGDQRPDAFRPYSTALKPLSPQPAMNTLKPCFMRCSTVCGSLAG